MISWFKFMRGGSKNKKDMRRKCDHEAVVAMYKTVRSYTPVAKKFKVTRERVRQLVKQYCPDMKPLRGWHLVERCLLCGRTEQEDKVEVGIRYCKDCYGLVRRAKKSGDETLFWTRYRNRKAQKTRGDCVQCGTSYEESPHGGRGLCTRCYNKWRAKLPSFKEAQKRYYQKNKEKVKEKYRQYYLAHKEELDAYRREYYKAYRLKKRLAQKEQDGVVQGV